MRESRLGSPLVLAISLYIVLVALSIVWLCAKTGGRFVYPLDDTYISMAIAKNWAVHGVMGVTRHEFSASTSCPLWILLIAAVYKVAGVNWWAPFLLSALAGVAVLVVTKRLLLAETGDARITRWTLAVLCVLLPLPALGLSGMEHTLHIALALPFVCLACRYLSAPSTAEWRWIPVLAAVMVMVRYESLFLIAIFCGLALLRRRWLAAVVTGAAAWLPIVLYGWYSVSQGWEWLPNTVLVKGEAPRLTSLVGVLMALGLRAVLMLVLGPHMLALLAGLAWVWKSSKESFWAFRRLVLFVVAVGIVLHMQFASVGWFFRYEAYLIALAVAALMVNRFDLQLQERFSRQALKAGAWSTKLALVAVLLGTLPMWFRAGAGLTAYPLAAYNIYEQQVQMALFLHRYYDGSTVAANDIGAINYFNDLRCLDMIGLADRDVFRLKRRHAYTSEALAELARRAGVRVAVLYNPWFDGKAGPKVPASWRAAGDWRVKDNGFLGGDTVTFYAVEAGEYDRLVRSLREFGPDLPASVRQAIR